MNGRRSSYLPDNSCVSSLRAIRLSGGLLLACLVALPFFARSQSDISYSGSTSGTWSDGTNWVGGTAPGSNDDANFVDGGNGFLTISLNGIIASHLDFNGANVGAYILGAGGIGAETFSLDGAAAAAEGIFLASNLSNDITVNANIELTGAAGTYRFDNRDLDNDLIINGVINAAGSGNQLLNFGDFNERASKVILNGDVTISTADRLTISVTGEQLTINGEVTGTGNTMRTIVRDGGVLTVSSTGKMGEGYLNLREGSVILNNTTTPQLLDNGLDFGHATTGDGDSFLTIAAGATLNLNGDLKYLADDDVANVATVSGGTIDLSGSSRNYTINDNALVTGSELILSTEFKGNGNDNASAEDLNIIGDGTLTWDSTINQANANELIDLVTFSNKKTVVGANGTQMTGVRRSFRVAQRNNATFSDFDIEFDINGQTVTFDDDFTLGASNSSNVTTHSFINITDSADSETSFLNLTGDNDITVNNGNTAGDENGDNRTVTISADIVFSTDTTMLFGVQDGFDDIDLDVSGTIQGAGGGGEGNVQKNSAGTIRLSATDNDYNGLIVADGKAIITNAGALGDNFVQGGINEVDGTLEIIAATDQTFFHVIRVGEHGTTAASAATDTGGFILLNNGAGTATFTASSTGFDIDTIADRTLTLGGSNTGDNTIEGVMRNHADANILSLVKQDAGKWILNGDNTYTGTTSVNEGTLEIGGTNKTDISVAAGAALGGEGSTTGTLTLVDGAVIDAVNGSTTSALTASGGLDLTGVSAGGILVNFANGGPGAFTVLDYGSTSLGGFTAGTNGETFFTNNTGLTASGRVGGGSGTFADTGTAITFDLGFETRTWAAAASTANWINGNTADNNWVEGDNDYFDGDAVIFTDASVDSNAPTTAQNVTIVGDVAPSSVSFTSNDADVTYEVGGAAITGSGSLSKTGTADVTLTGANTYTGGTSLGTAGDPTGAGITIITDSAAFGTGGVLIAGTNTELQINGAATGTIVNDFEITSDGNNRFIDFNLDGAGAIELSGDILINEPASFRSIIELGDDTVTMSGVVSGPGALNIREGGTLILNNDMNTFGSAADTNNGRYITIRNDATLQITSIANAGVDSAIGHVREIRFGTNDTDGTLNYVGATAGITDRLVIIGGANDTTGTGGAFIDNNGTGVLQFTNATFNITNSVSTEAKTLTLGGTNTGENRIDGVIADNNQPGGGIINLAKDDAGTWLLNGTNTYTGTTTVNGGTLGGTGSIAGGLTTVKSGATITAATDGTTGTFAIGSGGLDMEAGSTWLVDLVQGTSVDLITVGGTLNLNNANLVLNDSNFSDDGSIHNIASYSTLGATRFNGFSENAFVTGQNGGTYRINYGTVNANFITLTAVPEPQTWAAMGLLLAAAFFVYRRRRSPSAKEA
ncbi:MAG: autotransporter-associated beta strand repeat-containing protein [Verrucomicrobiales bacterium]|nr:autotransporter-associated beta strand repeat-containing protein [Verrucomicrobiales bacterium]